MHYSPAIHNSRHPERTQQGQADYQGEGAIR